MGDLKLYEVAGVVRSSSFYGEEHWTDGINHIGLDVSTHVVAPDADTARLRARCEWHHYYGCLCQVRHVARIDGVKTEMAGHAGMQLDRWRRWHRDLDFDAPWHQCNLTCFDTETTGLKHFEDRIIEIGWARYDHEAREWTKTSHLVNPGIPISEESVEITGITDEMVADAPTFAELACEVADELSNCLLIAHNRGFDVAFLQKEMQRAGVRYAAPPTLCGLELAKKTRAGQGRSNKVETLAGVFGLEVDDLHRAGDDAKAAGQIFLRLAAKHPWMRGATLREMVIWADEYPWYSDRKKKEGA